MQIGNGSRRYGIGVFLPMVYCAPIVYAVVFVNVAGRCDCIYICNYYFPVISCVLAIICSSLASNNSKLINAVEERRKEGYSKWEEILYFVVFDMMIFTLAISFVYIKETRG